MQYSTDRRIKRERLPLQILRGDYLTEPGKLTSLLPPIDGEAIKEGMLIVRATGTVGGETGQVGWRKATAADADGGAAANDGSATDNQLQFFIARHDQDSHDVQESGKLVGLNCSDNFELQSGYWDESITDWAVGDLLVAANGGKITRRGDTASVDVVIGVISEVGGATGNRIPYAGKTPSTSTADGNATLIQFTTKG